MKKKKKKIHSLLKSLTSFETDLNHRPMDTLFKYKLQSTALPTELSKVENACLETISECNSPNLSSNSFTNRHSFLQNKSNCHLKSIVLRSLCNNLSISICSFSFELTRIERSRFEFNLENYLFLRNFLRGCYGLDISLILVRIE